MKLNWISSLNVACILYYKKRESDGRTYLGNCIFITWSCLMFKIFSFIEHVLKMLFIFHDNVINE